AAEKTAKNGGLLPVPDKDNRLAYLAVITDHSVLVATSWLDGSDFSLEKLTTPFERTYTFSLIPGEHRVDVALTNRYVAQPTRVDSFPFAFRKQVVKIEAGKTHAIAFDASSRVITDDFTKRPNYTWRSRLIKRLNTVRELPKDITPLREAARHVQSDLPTRPVVMLDFGEDRGGSREYDVEQIQ